MLSQITSFLLALSMLSLSTALPNLKAHNLKPAIFFLAGDSTTAIINTAKTGGGWGDGFLATLKNNATGFNYGHNGRTTVSFRNGGDWSNVLAGVAGNKTEFTPFVTIQFGHNDQQPKANISIAQYSANLEQFGKDVREAGGEPIFVTPLSRRSFNSSSLVIEDLADQAAATTAVAKFLRAGLVDLNRASTDILNKIGPVNATLFNLIPADYTHLNEFGQSVFGSVVSSLFDHLEGEYFRKWTTPNETAFEELKKLF